MEFLGGKMDLSGCLSMVTFNGADLVIPKKDHINCYMGIGLWSKVHGLSMGLPIDVMQMLVAAKILTEKIGMESRVFILIADSMAIDEGADPGLVKKVKELYISSLAPFIALLRLNAEILLASDLVSSELEDGPAVASIEAPDYVRSQTAISNFMHTRLDVGIKIGWQKKGPMDKTCWDERRFDEHTGKRIQYLYTRAGLKAVGKGKTPCISEAPPYTAFAGDRRFVINTTDKTACLEAIYQGQQSSYHKMDSNHKCV